MKVGDRVVVVYTLGLHVETSVRSIGSKWIRLSSVGGTEYKVNKFTGWAYLLPDVLCGRCMSVEDFDELQFTWDNLLRAIATRDFPVLGVTAGEIKQAAALLQVEV